MTISSFMYKKVLTEFDICAKYITPAVIQAGWGEALQIRREVFFTKGRIIVRGKLEQDEQKAASLRDQLKAILAEALLR